MMKETKSDEEKLELRKKKAHKLYIFQAHELFAIRVEKVNDNSCIKNH